MLYFHAFKNMYKTLLTIVLFLTFNLEHTLKNGLVIYKLYNKTNKPKKKKKNRYYLYYYLVILRFTH